MISVICCSNNPNVTEDMLVQSLKTQSENYELILLDNTQHQYPSAAQALNHGAALAHGDILVFAHQDIRFSETDFLTRIQATLKENPMFIVGVAGVKDGSGVYTNITQGPQEIASGEHKIDRLTEVQTLDEVLMATTRTVFNILQFDEKTCDDWHLYGVDYCLSAYAKGIKSFVLPLDLYHLSTGNISLGYALTLFKVIRKHRKEVKFIYTTCSNTKTSTFRSIQYVTGLIWDHVLFNGKRHG